jgi:hypothetical protein
MSDVYLIKKETLTSIADVIREMSPNDYPEGTTITPEEMGNTAIYSVYNQGYADGQASSSEPTKVTDLTGSIWKLSTNIKKAPPSAYSINFVSNGTNYDKISGSASGMPIQISIKYSTSGTATTVYSGKVGVATWTHYNYRIIEISGGTDATNTALIDWLYTYGELLSGETAEDLEAIGDLCEWSVVITSEDFFSVSIRNYHPSYYLHCEIRYDEEISSNSIVVPPNSVRSWESGGNAVQDSYVRVTNVRWKRSAT